MNFWLTPIKVTKLVELYTHYTIGEVKEISSNKTLESDKPALQTAVNLQRAMPMSTNTVGPPSQLQTWRAIYIYII